MIKEGNDHFEVTHLEPKVEVCNRRYVFDAQPPPNSTKPLAFNPTGRCPAFVVAAEIAGPALEKEHNDEVQYAQLVKADVPVAPIRTGLDGGMNRVFLAQVGGNIPPARTPGSLPPQPPPAVTVDSGGAQPTFANRLLGGLFGSKPAAAPTQVAATDTASQERGGSGSGGFFGNLFSSKGSEQANAAAGSQPTATAPAESQKPKPAPHNETASAAGLTPKQKTEPTKSEPHKSVPQEANAAKQTPPQQEANAAIPPAKNGALLSGAQPVVPAGSFDSRWGGLQ
jgi:hypothetical protein